MHNGGFVHRKPRSPATLAGVVAIHAGVIAALVLIRGDYVPKINGPFPISFYPAPDPPPPPPTPQPEVRAKTDRPVDSRTPVTPTPDDSAIIRVDRSEPIILTGGDSDATDRVAPLPLPSPTAAPVLVEAAPDPRHAEAFQPPYPPAKQRLGEEGRVVLKVLVGTDGRVRATEIVASDDPAFSTVTVRQAMTRWRFRPATRDGVAVEAWRTMTVRFEMRR
ncbi:energy transducer TonB [Sphingomonas flavalba]|uniref:energy transducer TonB n=1 Tax=Sphingomonas flavalba TaxID=2559804 RepID=UPI0039E084A8